MQTDDFEWDDVKAALNFDKHGISFEEATFAFDDPKDSPNNNCADFGSGDPSSRTIDGRSPEVDPGSSTKCGEATRYCAGGTFALKPASARGRKWPRLCGMTGGSVVPFSGYFDSLIRRGVLSPF